MAVTDRLSAREAKRLQTRERLMGAAVAEFTRAGMAEADVSAIVAAAGVAHGTFFFHFPTKEHVLLELERREEDRIAKQFAQFLKSKRDLASALNEAVRLVVGLERRLGDLLFNDFLALHFSQTRPPTEDGRDHPLIVLVAQEIVLAHEQCGVLLAGPLRPVDHHKPLADRPRPAGRLRREDVAQFNALTRPTGSK